MAKATLSTTRLTIRPLGAEDEAELAALHADVEVMQFIGSGVRSPEAAAAEARRLIAEGGDAVLGPRVILRWEDGAFLGWVAIFALEGGPEREIGYRLRRRHWGRGYAREAAAHLRPKNQRANHLLSGQERCFPRSILEIN